MERGLPKSFIYREKGGSAMKCDVCSKDLAETFLKKIVGGYVKDAKGKMRPVCRECQKKLRTKEEILKHIK